MVSNIFHHSALQRRAVWLALFAILLIVVAPLISIALQKDPMNGMHHAMMGMPEGMPSHQMSMTHTDASMPEHAHSVPLDHAEAWWLLRTVSSCSGPDFRAGAAAQPDASTPASPGFPPGEETLA